MEKRELISNQLKASIIGFGGASISGEGGGYGFGHISEDDSISLIHEAIEYGINLFDTAPIYGFGESERRIGKALKNRRDNNIVISKSGIDWHENMRVNLSNEAKVTLRMLDQSLKRLDTEYIDIYMIHWPDPRVDIRVPMEILSREKEKGKIRFIGLCNTNQDEYIKAIEIDKIDVLQGELNFFKDDNFKEIESILSKNSLKTMSWGSLEKGILTKRVTESREYDEVDARRKSAWFKKKDVNPLIQKYEKIHPLMKKKKISGLELALGYNLQFDTVGSVLTGFRNSNQLKSILKALENLPNSEDIKELKGEYERFI